MPKRYQVAAIPFRQHIIKGSQVLLVTSRETRRWVVPKGWPWPHVADHEAAAGEAWEEAGVRGRVMPKKIGKFTYNKRRNEKVYQLKVFVYLLEVTTEADDWPEVDQRERKWFTQVEASCLVDEPELKSILLELGERTPATSGPFDRTRQPGRP